MDQFAMKIVREMLEGAELLLHGGQQAAAVMTEVLNRVERGESLSPEIVAHLRKECAAVDKLNETGQAKIESIRKRTGLSAKKH